MKRTLALLLVAVFAITCAIAALSVSAETPVYTDKVNLLPANQSDIRINGGTPGYELKDGKLSISRTAESNVAWPSIVYDVNVDLDLAKTPYLHMSFETSGEGDRGVNGHIYLKDADGNQVGLQISAMGGNGIDDFRDTDDMYIKIDLAKFIKEHIENMRANSDPEYDVTFNTTGKITITNIDLSVYGGVGETITWNALALAKEGADDGDDDEGEGDDNNNATTSSTEETSSTSSETEKVPTGDKGLLLFAVLGVVALAGVAVTVKVRH